MQQPEAVDRLDGRRRIANPRPAARLTRSGPAGIGPSAPGFIRDYATRGGAGADSTARATRRAAAQVVCAHAARAEGADGDGGGRPDSGATSSSAAQGENCGAKGEARRGGREAVACVRVRKVAL